MQTRHPTERARAEQIAILEEQINSLLQLEEYKLGLMCKTEGTFDTLDDRAQRMWRQYHSMITDMQEDVAQIKGFFRENRHHLGSVAFASGYRTKNLPHPVNQETRLSTLDWALISLEHQRPIKNQPLGTHYSLLEFAPSDKIKDFSTVASKQVIDSIHESSRDPESRAFPSLDTKDPVSAPWYHQEITGSKPRKIFFHGYRSRTSVGYYHGLHFVRLHATGGNGQSGEKIQTIEYCINGLEYGGGSVAQLGDSGSVIVDVTTRKILGMLFAGLEYNDVAFFMRVNDLVQDIKSQSCAADFRIYFEDDS